MLTSLRWLALEAKYLDRARSFYARHLGLSVRREDDREVTLDAGDADLVLRRPVSVPRGGLHTHYAFSTPDDAYDEWWERLSEGFDLEEHRFGRSRSLYFDDPDDNCVEIGQRGGAGGERKITGIFEVVLEVADLSRAEGFYAQLGFETVDRGEERRRVRMRGPMDLELWEPQLGLADARGGVHVDLGLDAEDPRLAAERISEAACSVEPLEEGIRVRDPDGHYLTFV